MVFLANIDDLHHLSSAEIGYFLRHWQESISDDTKSARIKANLQEWIDAARLILQTREHS
jgi:hypothetical protein